jgi:hypothetical protein
MMTSQELNKLMYSNTTFDNDTDNDTDNEETKIQRLEQISINSDTVTYKTKHRIYKINPKSFITIDNSLYTQELLDYFINNLSYYTQYISYEFFKKNKALKGILLNRANFVYNYKISIDEINNNKYIIFKTKVTYNTIMNQTKTLYLGYEIMEYNNSFKNSKKVLKIFYKLNKLVCSKYIVNYFYLNYDYCNIKDEYSELITHLKNLLKKDEINNYNDIYDEIDKKIEQYAQNSDIDSETEHLQYSDTDTDIDIEQINK